MKSTDRSARQKIKKIVALSNTLDQSDLIGIFRALQPEAAEHTFFSSAHETFFKTDHMLGHKTSLNKFKKIEIISSIFSDYFYETGNQSQGIKTWKTQRHGG